jgi:hypothetical protein
VIENPVKAGRERCKRVQSYHVTDSIGADMRKPYSVRGEPSLAIRPQNRGNL